MCATVSTKHLCALHAEAVIFLLDDGVAVDGLVETGPTTTGIKLYGGVKQLLLATNTMKHTVFLKKVVLATERAFCPLFTADVVLLIGQFFTPLLIRFFIVILLTLFHLFFTKFYQNVYESLIIVITLETIH